MKPRVVIDLESCSILDLPTVGAHVYAAEPTTAITVLCYGFDTGPVHTWLPGQPPPGDLQAMIMAGATVVAHNYQFEMALYAQKLVPLGWWPIEHDQWSCTMARALVAGYPAKLETACEAAHLAIKKDSSARDLMLRFARPRKLDPLTWWHETDPDRYIRLQQYCAQDVAAERALDQAVPELSPQEYQVFLADQAINERGLRVDTDLVNRMHALGEAERKRINTKLSELTGGVVTSGSQVARLTAWLAGQGFKVDTLGRDSIEKTIEDIPRGVVRDVLQARLDVSRSSTAKLVTIQRSTCADSRVRGTVQYYGANRTGRWAGRRFQPQNLPRGTIKNVSGAVTAIQQDTPPEDLDLMFEDSPMGVLASCLRSTIEAAPGHVLVSADLSQIEARVLCWLAGQTDILDIFAKGKLLGTDVYTYTAQRIGSRNRQLGKVLVLACGYQMGPTRFMEAAAGYDIILSPQEAEDAVDGWRRLNHRIVAYWYDAHNMALRLVAARPGSYEKHRFIGYERTKDALQIVLPNGRRLIYREPELARSKFDTPVFSYLGLNLGHWGRQSSSPGRLVENITQAVARDVMAEGMVKVHSKGIPLIGTIHDELIAEVTEARGEMTKAWMLWAMRRPLAWAPGLPVDAAGFVARRYQKG